MLEFGEANLQERDFAVAADGSLFLLEQARGEGRARETVVVLDWITELEAKLRQLVARLRSQLPSGWEGSIYGTA